MPSWHLLAHLQPEGCEVPPARGTAFGHGQAPRCQFSRPRRGSRQDPGTGARSPADGI